MTLTEAMRGADFVQLNGVVFATEYLRVPDESTVPDDVVMELRLAIPSSSSPAASSTAPPTSGKEPTA